MTVLDAVIQGIVQGFTEFLPVSSSGHLLISQHILGVSENNLFFDVILHLGTLLAVIAVYYKLIIRLIKAFFDIIKDVFTGKFKWKELKGDNKLVIMLIIGLLPLFLLFLPVGKSLNVKNIAQNLMESSSLLVVSVSLLITSILLFLAILKTKGQRFNSKLSCIKKEYSVADATCVGFTQMFAAILPGLSRSGSTLCVGLFRGINKQTALDYSFILGIPAILAASVLEFKEIYDTGYANTEFLPILVGFVFSAVVGFFAIKLFRWLLKSDRIMIFVIYTSVIGLLALFISIIELIRGVNLFTGISI